MNKFLLASALFSFSSAIVRADIGLVDSNNRASAIYSDAAKVYQVDCGDFVGQDLNRFCQTSMLPTALNTAMKSDLLVSADHSVVLNQKTQAEQFQKFTSLLNVDPSTVSVPTGAKAVSDCGWVVAGAGAVVICN
jgi:hypothetical protein